jgi:hypothetical protein
MAVNVGETLFRLGWTVVLLHSVVREAKKRFAFEMRGLKFEGALLTFYIKPADGTKLPKIMQWMVNGVYDELRSLSRRSRRGSMRGRGGRARVGDRYWSEILEGDSSKEAAEVDWAAVDAETDKEILAAITYSLSWASPRLARMREKLRFSFKTAPIFASSPLPKPTKKKLTAPIHRKKGDTDSLHNAVQRRPQGKSVRRVRPQTAKLAFCRIDGASRRRKEGVLASNQGSKGGGLEQFAMKNTRISAKTAPVSHRGLSPPPGPTPATEGQPLR